MDDLERLLREQPLEAPSEALDRKLARAFADASLVRPRLFHRAIPVWACGLIGLTCALSGFFLGAQGAAEQAATVERVTTYYILDGGPQSRMSAFGASSRQRPTLIRPVEPIIEVPSRKGAPQLEESDAA